MADNVYFRDALELAPYVNNNFPSEINLNEEFLLRELNAGKIQLDVNQKIHFTTPKMFNFLKRFDKAGIKYKITLDSVVKTIHPTNTIFSTQFEIETATDENERVEMINKLYYVLYNETFPIMDVKRYFVSVDEELTDMYQELNRYIQYNGIEYLYFQFDDEVDKKLFCRNILNKNKLEVL